MAVQEALADAGVEVYCGYVLAEWALKHADDDDERGEVTSVSFTSNDAPLTLNCVVSILLLLFQFTLVIAVV